MITIHNEKFTASIALRGAELRSLKETATATEMIWQADPAIWAGSAPILFPIVGKLLNGKTLIQDREYEIPKHGLLRTRDAELIEQGDDFAVFQFSSDEQTRKLYPFAFLFQVTFQLNGHTLSVKYSVQNNGVEEMLFSIGSHPAFALDQRAEALDDYFIEFNEPETLDLYGLKDGAFALRQPDYLSGETRIPLSNTLFNEDALIFCGIQSDKISLKCNTNPRYLQMDTFGAPDLGIWAKPGAAYVCIEPWYGYDDPTHVDGMFKNKPGLLSLPAGETFETGYAVSVMDADSAVTC